MTDSKSEQATSNPSSDDWKNLKWPNKTHVAERQATWIKWAGLVLRMNMKLDEPFPKPDGLADWMVIRDIQDKYRNSERTPSARDSEVIREYNEYLDHVVSVEMTNAGRLDCILQAVAIFDANDMNVESAKLRAGLAWDWEIPEDSLPTPLPDHRAFRQRLVQRHSAGPLSAIPLWLVCGTEVPDDERRKHNAKKAAAKSSEGSPWHDADDDDEADEVIQEMLNGIG